MSDSKELGQKGEDIASDYLAKKGYKIVARNWRWGLNEIDIVVEDADFMVFVEVKTRAGNYLEHPSAAVAVSKQKAIIKTADQYINKYSIDKESRFDIITIVQNKAAFEIVHIEAAFYPSLK